MRRRIFLLCVVVAVSAGMSAAQHAVDRLVLYAALGSDLATYDVDLAHAALARRSSVTLPFAVQYAWPHPSKKFLYVAWSNGMQGDRHGITVYRVDAAGALAPHGPSIEIRHRPVHLTLDANATHVLVAYNNPSGLSVHSLNADGTLGSEVKQPGSIDGGIYAHQIRVHPSNKMVVMVTRGNGPTPAARRIRARSRFSATTMEFSKAVSPSPPTADSDISPGTSTFTRRSRGCISTSNGRISCRFIAPSAGNP